jgi:hypothetical protein
VGGAHARAGLGGGGEEELPEVGGGGGGRAGGSCQGNLGAGRTAGKQAGQGVVCPPVPGGGGLPLPGLSSQSSSLRWTRPSPELARGRRTEGLQSRGRTAPTLEGEESALSGSGGVPG